MISFQTIVKVMTDISRRCNWSVHARFIKATEELGEMGTAVLVNEGEITHKVLKEPIEGEWADTFICTFDTIAQTYPDLSHDEIFEMFIKQLMLKIPKWAAVVDKQIADPDFWAKIGVETPVGRDNLKRIAEQLEDGDGPGLIDILQADERIVKPEIKTYLKTVISWVFEEEKELRDLLGKPKFIDTWKPIADFDFEKDAQCRMRWILASEEHVIGECYFGQGARYAGEMLNDEPHIEAWRYVHGDRRVPAHLVPAYFQPIPDAPKNSK
jgi:hypothetical protein